MANQIVVSAGAKVRNLSGVLTGTSGVVSSVPLGAANGVATLDSGGKVPVSQLPSSVVTYLGTWNAATNTPTLANGTGDAGDMYICNVAGTVNFGAGPVVFVVGDWVLYGSGTWQKSSGQNGTVTSVAVTESGDSLNITGSPITTSGTINIGFNGTNLQYVNGAGNLTTFPTLITSIGLSMPSAFSVANSPLTTNGTIAVTGAGVASQYIRGDGTLADFPSSGGGGSSVSYYLNGGTSQGTIGGTTYYEMSKTAVIGTGVDFAKSGDGFIVAFLTDANDPAQLNIPAGNWNYEIYASMSSNGGTPQLYAELYVYNGTTFTLISTSSNEILYDGTNLNLYSFAMTVPATTLALTDRLAIKLYATNSGGKTTTIHTQDSHLCQVITTFSTGITALNGLTAQVQYFQTGTSGTDFNISSTTATHTFNIPDASATARGLITTGTQTIAGTKTFNDATKNNGGIFLQNASSNSLAGYMNLGGLTNGLKFTSGGGISNSFTLPSATGYTFTFPNATGTLALTSDISYPVTSVFGRTGAVVATSGDYTTAQVTESGNLYFTDSRARLALSFVAGSGAYNSTTGVITIPTNNNQITNGSNYITLGSLSAGVGISYNNTTGVITNSAPDQVVALTASTGISVTGTYPNFTITNTSPSSGGTVTSVAALTIGTSGTDVSSTVANSTTTPVITLNIPSASATNRGLVTTGTQTFAGAKTFNSDIVVNGLKIGTGVMNIATNTAVGVSALNAGTGAGDYNVAVGYNAMLVNINGAESVAIGTYSLRNNLNGANNTAVGMFALSGNTNGYYNTAVGHSALTANTIGEGNTAVGISSLGAVTTGTYNIGIGQGAGVYITTGSKNTIVGKYAGTTTMANNVVLADGDGNVRFQWDGTNVLLNGNTAITKSGTITTNYLPKFIGASTIGNSQIFDNGTQVGINTITPNSYYSGADNLVIYQGTGEGGMSIVTANNTTGAIYFADGVTGDEQYRGGIAYTHTTDLLSFVTSGASKMFLNSSGNLGLGVTPSAWASAFTSIQGGSFNSSITFQNNDFDASIWTNSYFNGTNSIYIATGAAARFRVNNNTFQWLTAPSGTAGNAITFTQAMTLFSTGNLAVGTTTDSGYKLDVNGTGRFSGAVGIGTSSAIGSYIFAIEYGGSAAAVMTIKNSSVSGYSGTHLLNSSGTLVGHFGYANASTGAPLTDKIYFGSIAAKDVVFTTNDTVKMTIASSGAITCTSSVTATSFFESSSIKGKDIIATNPLLALDIDVIKYTRKSDESKDIRYGYSAEQIHSLMPELTDKDVTAVKYLDVHTILISQLQKEIKELKAKMN